MQGELKVRELERFKALYCGLCHALGKKYGVAARFVLNYELVLLAMLLWDENEQPLIKRRRCMASPCISKRYCARNTALDICAAYSIILTWWKLRDTVADEPFFKALPHRMALLVLSRAYKKAAREFAEFDGKVGEEVARLAEYGSLGDKSLDGAADKFAQILKAAAPRDMPENKRRVLSELLYHLGRWVYIIDACDDFGDDAKAGRFNPVAARFTLSQDGQGEITDEATARLKTTLTHSNNLLCSAFELLPENAWTQIVGNMVYLAMPDVCERIVGRSRIRNSELG
jgi:hypothetical protein